MKSLKTLVSLTALTVCMGAASMANAFSISPEGTFTTSTGSITVLSPSSSLPVTCPITFSGKVTGGVATITGATVGGSGLCALPVLKNIPTPGWVLTATSASAGTVTNVGYTIAGLPPIIPASNCGATTINVAWNGGTHTLSASGQPLSGSCTVQSLSVVATSLSIIP
jgi:hypothetical protein